MDAALVRMHVYILDRMAQSTGPTHNKQVQYVALKKQQKKPGSRFFNELGLNGMCQNKKYMTSKVCHYVNKEVHNVRHDCKKYVITPKYTL